MRKLNVFAVFLAIFGTSAEVRSSDVKFLDQNWDETIRNAYYYTPQGSPIMRNDWFRALETKNGTRFSDPMHLTQFGLYPPDGTSDLNPDGYPIGLAVDGSEDGPAFVGLTCAACHNGEVTIRGQRVRIEGGAGHFNFDAFYQALSTAVTATARDDEAFTSFAKRVLGDDADADAIKALKGEFVTFQVAMEGDVELRVGRNEPGFGRVDALTQSINALAVRDQATVQNLVPVDAPVSYPPVWLAPDLEFVQYSPIAASPIARNSGEVLAVFGITDLTPGTSTPFSSTIKVHNLDLLEQWLMELEPPKWDEELMGKIDVDLAAEGEELFAETCAACHNMKPYKRTDPAKNAFGKTFIEIGRVDYREIGTDPTYFDVLVPRMVQTNAVTATVFGDAPVVPAVNYFVGVVGSAIRTALSELDLSQEELLRLNGYRFSKEDGKLVPYEPTSMTDLKASPLAGVWATGPYLHNGSVPTIYELLSPEWERRDVFYTGGTEVDLQRLGFVSEGAPDLFRFDTSLPGNANTGHNYPRGGLTHTEKMAIIEYLKTQ